MKRPDPDVAGLQSALDARTNAPDKLAYTVNEAIKAIGLGRTTIYRLIGEGKLKLVKVGGRSLIPAESLRALIANAPSG